MRSAQFKREAAWKRLLHGFNQGHCLVTLGTGPGQQKAFEGVALLPSHSYAVTGIQEESWGERIVTFLDSWVTEDTHNLRKAKISKLPWDDVVEIFEGLYISWNPSLWSNHLIFHGRWQRPLEFQGHSGATYRATLNLVRIKSEPDQQVWLLLTRHITDTRRTSDYISISAQFEDSLRGSSIHSSSYLVSSKNSYTNGPHSLCKVNIPSSQSSGSLSISCAYDGDSNNVGFTLSAYASGADLAWQEPAPVAPFSQTVHGTLTTKSGGGNPTYPSFMMNPQYTLKIQPGKNTQSTGADTAISAQSNKDMPLNILGVWGTKERVTGIKESSVAFSSGVYTYGYARISAALKPGIYTVILSSFDPQHTGPFSLTIDSHYPFELRPILQEGAGMYTTTLKQSWTSDTAVGAPKFGNYWKNPSFSVDIPISSQVKIRLQLLKPSVAALNVSVFPENNTIPILTSGPYDDIISGVCTDKVTLQPGKYVLVPSTYSPKVETSFQILVYSNTSEITVTEK